MTEQKKSAQAAGTAQGASKNTLHINDSTETEEMQELFRVISQQSISLKYVQILFKIRNIPEVRKRVSAGDLGLLTLDCYSLGIIIGKRQERARRRRAGETHD